MRIYVFLVCMWGLILAGGGMAVMVLGPMDFGPQHQLATSATKAVAAVLLVVAWVAVLARTSRYVFRS